MARLSPLFTWRSAICESDLPSTTRHVGLTISLHMSERGDSCYPSVPTLVRETGLARRTVQRHLQTLQDEGWLDRWLVDGGGEFPHYHYRATFRGSAYRAYLRTPHWRRLRERVLDRRGEQCETCGSENRVELHHETYRRIARERPEDLTALCRRHHREAHR